MTGAFKVDRDRIYDFHKRFLQRVAIYLGVLLTFFLILIFSTYDGKVAIYSAVVVLICCVVVFAGVMAQTGGIAFKAFERTRIILEDGRVIRMGDGLMTSRIKYKEIGRVVRLSHGIVIIKKGIFPFLTYYFSRYPLRLHYNIIFIPYPMKDYDALKDFFVNKKYLHVDTSL